MGARRLRRQEVRLLAYLLLGSMTEAAHASDHEAARREAYALLRLLGRVEATLAGTPPTPSTASAPAHERPVSVSVGCAGR
jgi:hypothetical protein